MVRPIAVRRIRLPTRSVRPMWPRPSTTAWASIRGYTSPTSKDGPWSSVREHPSRRCWLEQPRSLTLRVGRLGDSQARLGESGYVQAAVDLRHHEVVELAGTEN